jgi:GT2 family glycosyltransferase
MDQVSASAASKFNVRVAATVVNYKAPELSAKVVTSLLAQLRPLGEHRLCLVDNASGDHSLRYFRV